MKFYAGIGSRTTPSDILAKMTDLANELSPQYTLHSGGAPGADTAFERGAFDSNIYLPWPGFQDRSYGISIDQIDIDSYNLAVTISSLAHPYWNNLSGPVKNLMIRNVFQVLDIVDGLVKQKATAVICWTPDGSTGETTRATGGTGQAIRIAMNNQIPVYNMKTMECKEILERMS
jgi:hypothetical protein